MAFSIIAAKKLFDYLFLRETREFLKPDIIIVSLHSSIPSRNLTNSYPTVAQSTATFWQYAGETNKIHNSEPIEAIATSSARVNCVVTWAIINQNPIHQETYPIGIIPLVPFDVRRGQKIKIPDYSLQIVLGSHELIHRDFAAYILGHFYLENVTFPEPQKSFFAGTETQYGSFFSWITEVSWELSDLENTPLPILKNNSPITTEVTGNLTGDVWLQHLIKWQDNSSTSITASFQPESNFSAGNSLVFPPGGIELFLDNGNLQPLGDSNFRLLVLDIPLLEPEHSALGLYIGVTASIDYSSAIIELKVSEEVNRLEEDWLEVARINTHTKSAIIDTASLSNTANNLSPDNSTVLIADFLGEITSASLTIADWHDEAILALWGNEIISIKEIELQPDGKYQIKKLIRGLRGTESFIHTHDPSGESLVILENLFRIPLSLEDLDRELIFRAKFDNGEIVTNTIYFQNIAGLPLAPAIAKIVETRATGNVTISLAYRSTSNRIARKSEIDILAADGTFLRTITSSDNNVIYSRNDRLIDFGILTPTLSFVAYNVGDFGRGYGTRIDTTISTFK